MTATSTPTTIHIAVGSKNPVKVAAVKDAFELIQGKVSFLGENVSFQWHAYDVVSGVSDQPMSEEETRRGSYQRAVRTLEAFKADPDVGHGETCHFAVGLEGGCAVDTKPYACVPNVQVKRPDALACYAWMAILRVADMQMSDSRTATFYLPPAVHDLMMRDGLELGKADDIVFKRKDSKKSDG